MSHAEKMLRTLQVLPQVKAPFRFGKPVVGGTHSLRRREKNAKRENRRLDVQVTYPVLVNDLPMIGGGSDFQVTLGDQGHVIAYSGVWREPKHLFDAKLIEPRRRRRAVSRIDAGAEDRIVRRVPRVLLGAVVSRAGIPVSGLCLSGTAKFGKRSVPLRQIIVPATEFGTPIAIGQPQPPLRKKTRADYRRRTRSGAGDAEKDIARRSLAKVATRPWEAGTSWIGLSGGLAGSQQNAQGFVDQWANAGWHIDFNWGDGNAWESDWTSNDDNYVDNADFVFYTGHANMNGWVLAATGGDGWLNFTERRRAPAILATSGAKATSSGRSSRHVDHCKTT